MKPFSILDQVLSKSERRRLKYVGVKKTIKPQTNFTSLEIKYYNMLDEIGAYFIPQYPLGGKFYDVYIPNYNVLIEFDGDFWHPLTEADCKYKLQIKNFNNDKIKNKIADDAGFRLVRIRESDDVSKTMLQKIICG
jgi:hypothetical protein